MARAGSAAVIALLWLAAACTPETAEKPVEPPAEKPSLTTAKTAWCHVASTQSAAAMFGGPATAVETIDPNAVSIPGCVWTSADGGKSVRLNVLAEEDIASGMLTAARQFDDLQTYHAKTGPGTALAGLGGRATRFGFAPGAAPQGTITIETPTRGFEIEARNVDGARAEAFVRTLTLDAAAR